MADETLIRRTPFGVSKLTGPAIKVTLAPAAQQAAAMAKPILPVLWLEI